MILWLDDIREPWKHLYTDAHWAQSAESAILALKTGKVTFASLDHDLSIQSTLGLEDNELTGYDVVRWMEENNVWPKDGVAIHSMNPVGAERMRNVIGKHYTFLKHSKGITTFWNGTAGGK